MDSPGVASNDPLAHERVLSLIWMRFCRVSVRVDAARRRERSRRIGLGALNRSFRLSNWCVNIPLMRITLLFNSNPWCGIAPRSLSHGELLHGHCLSLQKTRLWRRGAHIIHGERIRLDHRFVLQCGIVSRSIAGSPVCTLSFPKAQWPKHGPTYSINTPQTAPSYDIVELFCSTDLGARRSETSTASPAELTGLAAPKRGAMV